jgi:hypothetical protein
VGATIKIVAGRDDELRALRQTLERQASAFARQELAHERFMARMDRRDPESERFEESMRRLEAETARILDRVVSRLEDLTDQIRVNTEATWRMLDRLGPAPGES